MDLNRLRLGELVAGVCGVLLIIVMFLSWYGIGGALGGGLADDVAKSAGVDVTVNAWQSFDFIDLLLFVTAIVAIGAAVLTATQRSVALPVAASVIVTGLGVLVTLLVAYRLLNEPGPDKFIDIKFGAYLGFLICAGIALGGFMSMRDEGTSFGQAAQQAKGRGDTTQPPAAPAPPPAAPGQPPAGGSASPPSAPPPGPGGPPAGA